MSGKDFGGVMKLRDSLGNNISLRGTFTISPGDVSVDSVTNQDGSPDRIVTPQAPSATIVFADKNVDLGAIMRGERRNITFVEDFTGALHMYTRAFYTGKAESNRLNGEVSGVGIVGEFYRKAG